MKNGKQRCRDGKPFCRDSQQHYRAPKNYYGEKKGTARGKVEFITDVRNLATPCNKDCCSGIKDIGGYKWGIKLGKPGPNVCVYLVCEHKPNKWLCDAKVKFSLIGKKEYCHKCQYEISGGNVSSEYKCVFPIKYEYVTDTSNGLVDSKGNVTIRAEIFETCYEHPDGYTDVFGKDDYVGGNDNAGEDDNAGGNDNTGEMMLSSWLKNSLQTMEASIRTFKNLISSEAFTALDCPDALYYAGSLEKFAVSLNKLENEVVKACSFKQEEESWKEFDEFKDSSTLEQHCTFPEKPKTVVAEIGKGSISFVSNIYKWTFPLMLSSQKIIIAGAEWSLIVEKKLDSLCAYINCKPQLSGFTYEITYAITLRNSGLVEKGLAVFDKSNSRSGSLLIDWNDVIFHDVGWVDCLGDVSFDAELSVMRMATLYVFTFWVFWLDNYTKQLYGGSNF